jgi:hypothetical protein
LPKLIPLLQELTLLNTIFYLYQTDLSSFYQTFHLYLMIAILAHSRQFSTPIVPDFKDSIGIIVLTDHHHSF